MVLFTRAWCREASIFQTAFFQRLPLNRFQFSIKKKYSSQSLSRKESHHVANAGLDAVDSASQETQRKIPHMADGKSKALLEAAQ